MMNTKNTLRSLLLLGALAALPATSGAGCATQRDEVNRVQANYQAKSFFVRQDASGAWRDDSDSWYFRATVVDAPSANSVPAYVGTGGSMYRVKWRIDESWLLAYDEYPTILGGGDAHGSIVAAFPILSHFDIRKSYNSTTGEESNVLEENTSDRPWWARDYMRVDWSTNKLSEAGFVFPAYESVSAATYYVQDPSDPDHPVFTDGYFDITAHYHVTPTPNTCALLYRTDTCSSGDVRARISFMKVPQRDYVPREYPDRLPFTDDKGETIRSVAGTPFSLPMNDQFGIFRVMRTQYDRRMGSLEQRVLYRARIWNIWQQWFKRDGSGNIQYSDPDKKSPVLLPYSERKVRPIVFFVNPKWPEELKPMAQMVADSWNDAMQEVVASDRLLEKKVGAAVTMAEVRAEVDAMKGRKEDVFVLCKNNPVKAGDPAVCGKEGDVARLGDQRYNFFYWVDKDQPTGPLGLGPSYSDPVTGELFSAAAHIYGAALDRLAQQALDAINLLNGKWKEGDYIEGVNTDLFAKRLAAGEVPGPGKLDPSFKFPGEPGFDLGALKKRVETTLDRPNLAFLEKNGPPVAKGPQGKDRLALIKGTPLEKALLDNPEARALVGKSEGESLATADVEALRETFFGHDFAQEEAARSRFLGEHDCFYPTEFTDDAVLGIAKELLKKYGSGSTPIEDETIQKKMWQEIRVLYGLQVTQHEVGHTLGMAHNFEGSADPVNFFDEWWKLKGDKPKYGAPLSAAEIDGKVLQYQYSTVMDYTSRWNSEVSGLGKYDYATMRFAYGNVVEAFPKDEVIDPLYTVDPSAFRANLGFQGYSAELLDGIHRTYRHWTQLPGELKNGTKSLMKLGRELRRFEDVHEHAQNLYRTTAADKRNGVKTGSWKPTSASAKIYDATNPLDIVPYRWCGDQFAGSVGRPLCMQWDTGLDSFEVVQDAINRYKNYYVFDAFIRGRVNGNTRLRSYLSTVQSRYFSHVHRHYVYWLFNGIYGSRPYYWANTLDDGSGGGVTKGYIGDPDWYKDPGGGLPSTLAVTWGLDRLIDVLGTPDPGTYALDPATGTFKQRGGLLACSSPDGTPIRCTADATQAVVGIEDGARYRYTQWDTSSGHDFWNRPKVIGAFYDKIAAMVTMTNSQANFVGQDTTNAVSYRIGFYLAYPKALTGVFGGLVTDKLDNYAWRYSFDGGKAKLGSGDLFSALGRVDGAPKVDALPGKPLDSDWQLYYKGYALLFSMSEFQANLSQAWNDSVRVFCVGCGESFTPGAGIPTVSFTNPLNGKEYAAIVYGDVRFSGGAQLVQHGQTLAKAYTDAVALPTTDPTRAAKMADATSAMGEHIKLIDLVRGLYGVYGYTRF